MITEFGKILRKIRIDRDEILKDMASRLGVTAAYLSSIENGKREIPGEWVSEIARLYDLDEEESREIEEAALASRRSIKFNLEEESDRDRDLLLAFARRFRDLSDGDVREMKEILERKE